MTDEILISIPNKKPKRHRVTKTGLIDRRAIILEIVRDAQPATVRQIFYLASVRGAVAKDESGYDRVQGDLLAMRREGQLPYAANQADGLAREKVWAGQCRARRHQPE